MVHAGGPLATIVVGSVALADAATPPPATVAWLVTLAGAFPATFTKSVMGGELAPAANESKRLQPIVGVTAHSHPVPCMETAVSPAGRMSDTRTSCPTVVGAVPLLLTLMV